MSQFLSFRALHIKLLDTNYNFIKNDVVVFYKVVNKIKKFFYPQFIKKFVIVLYVDIKLLTDFNFKINKY